MNPRVFVLRRWGEFGCSVSGETYCSVQPVDRYVFRYAAEIRAESLDDYGFIADQQDVARVFSDITHTEYSCERLAEYAVLALRKLAPQACEVRVCIQPPPYVSEISAQWALDVAHDKP